MAACPRRINPDGVSHVLLNESLVGAPPYGGRSPLADDRVSARWGCQVERIS